MAKKLNLTVSMIAAALALAACGGGGGDSPNHSPSSTGGNTGGSNPTNAQLEQPQLIVAPANYAAAVKVDAFNKLNEIRALAGLGLLAQNKKMDQASQAHATWEALNGATTHYETPGTPGYTGTSPEDRLRTAGYSFGTGGEVIAYGLHGSLPTGAQAITSLVGAIYHRLGVLSPGYTEVGIGADGSSYPRPVNLKVAVPAGSNGQSIPNNAAAVVWPVNGATGMPVAMGGEMPNPIPELSVYALGYPVSVHCHHTQVLKVTSFVLRENSGTVVDAALRHWTSDPNNIFQSVKCAAALVPRAALKEGTTYKAEFVGSIDGAAVQKNWQFTTVQY